MPDKLTIKYESLEELSSRFSTRNPKTHAMRSLAESVRRFGFSDPVAVNEATGRLVEGHGRVEVLGIMRAAGEEPPARVVVKDGKWFVPVVRGLAFDTDEQAEAYLLAHNRLTELGGWDEALLLEVLRDLDEQGREAFVGVGFTEHDLKKLTEQLEAEIGQPGAAGGNGAQGEAAGQEFKSVDVDASCDNKCPSCGFEWNGPSR